MTQTVRVDAASIRSYGGRAQGRFDEIRSSLVRLVAEAATVQYFGPNASKFKQQCADMAEQYSTKMLKDLGTIADAVRTSTSNIASSLGGSPISIQVNGSPVPIPAISQGDGAVVANLDALTTLSSTIQGQFQSIIGSLQDHMRDLQSTDWTGNAKTNAVDAVGRFTNLAVSDTTTAQKSITDFITHQVESTRSADA